MKYLTHDTQIKCIHGGTVNFKPPKERSLKINGKALDFIKLKLLILLYLFNYGDVINVVPGY